MKPKTLDPDREDNFSWKTSVLGVFGAIGLTALIGNWYANYKPAAQPTDKKAWAHRILEMEDRSHSTRQQIREAMALLDIPSEERRAQERVWELIDAKKELPGSTYVQTPQERRAEEKARDARLQEYAALAAKREAEELARSQQWNVEFDQKRKVQLEVEAFKKERGIE